MAEFESIIFYEEDFTGAVAEASVTVVSGIDISGGDLAATGITILGAAQVLEQGLAFDQNFFSESDDAACTDAPPTGSDPPFPPVWPYPTGLIYGREHYTMNLRMVRGDTFIFSANIVLDGEAVDITGAQFRFTAKWAYTDADGDAVFAKTTSSGITIVSAPDGQIRVTINPADTSGLPAHQVDLFYDLQMLDSGGQIFTVLRGTLTVVPDVSVTSP